MLCLSVSQMGEGKGCVLCRNGLDKFGYRDVLLLRQFLTPHGLIIGRRHTGRNAVTLCPHGRLGACAFNTSLHLCIFPAVLISSLAVVIRGVQENAEQDCTCHQKIKKNGFVCNYTISLVT